MTRVRTTSVGRVLCLGGASLGALGLVGWLTGVDALVAIAPGEPPMMPNTALALLLLGIAGALLFAEHPRRTTQFLSVSAAVITLAIGLGTVAEYMFDLPFSIDQLFIRTDAGPYPGRPSPPTALDLALLAAAILVLDLHPFTRTRASEWLSLCAGLIAFTALLAQAFGAGELYEIISEPVVGVAVPTALGLLMISLGVLLERPHRGAMGLATSSGPGGLLLRRLSAVAVLVPVFFGLAATWLLTIPGVNEVSVLLTLVVMSSLVSLALLTSTAEHLNRVHDALEQTRQRTRDLIDLAADGIFIADSEGRFVGVNNAGCQMLGCPAEDILGKKFLDFIPPADVERLQAHKARLREGISEVCEWALRRKDGSHMPVEVSAKILPDGRWLAFGRDISARRHAEDNLRLSEAKFSGIVSISADAIISIDEDQRITLFNEGAEKIFGWSSATVIGAPLTVLIPERFRAIHARDVENFAAGPDAARRMGAPGGAIYGLRKNGEEFPADAAISRMIVGGNRILTVALRDITEQKRAETEQELLTEVGAVLAETLEFDDTLTNIARLVVRDLADYCLVDVVEDDGNIRRARAVCRDPSKIWVCDALMKAPLDGEPPRIAGSALKTRQADIIQKITPEVINSWARNEEERTALQNAGFQSAITTPLLAHGKLLGALVLISERPARTYGQADLRMAEAIAQQAAFSLDNARLYREAKRATQARDDMLGIVAHDLRNPLAAILTLAAVLRARGSEREASEEIGNAANRMNRLIQDLLDVTRMEAGRLSLRRYRLEATEVFSDSLETETPLASSASIELVIDAAPDLPSIWADRDRLLQVFENLIGNAIKFTKPGGRITLGATARAGEVTFSVTDTGCGIATSHLPHIFDRFWQAPEAARRGTGLGLAIVKGIVEAHGGRVWVQSSPGQGSTFSFTIPTAASQIAAGQRAATHGR